MKIGEFLTNLIQLTTRSHSDLQNLTNDDHIRYVPVGGNHNITNVSSGLDASKPASPLAGDAFFATDTKKHYFAYTANTWTEIQYPFFDISAAQGDIVYRGAQGWNRLGAGTLGQYLKTSGAAANPAWTTLLPLSPAIGDIVYWNGSAWTSLPDAALHKFLASGGVGIAPSYTDLSGGTPAQGDVLYYNGTQWINLPAGTSGNFLTTNGAAANPSWTSAPGITKILDETITTAVASHTTATFTAKEMLIIYIYILHGGINDTFNLRFNGDTTTTYAYRNQKDLVGSSSANLNSSVVLSSGASSDDYLFTINIYNPASVIKSGTAIYAEFTGGGATPDTGDVTFTWNNTTAQITNLTLLSASNLGVNTRILVYGV